MPGRQLGHASVRRRRPSPDTRGRGTPSHPGPSRTRRPRSARPPGATRGRARTGLGHRLRGCSGRTPRRAPRSRRSSGRAQKAGSCSCPGPQSWISSSLDRRVRLLEERPAQRLGGPRLGDERLPERVVAVDEELVPPVEAFEEPQLRAAGRTCRPRPGCRPGRPARGSRRHRPGRPSPCPFRTCGKKWSTSATPSARVLDADVARSSRSTCPSGSRSGHPDIR